MWTEIENFIRKTLKDVKLSFDKKTIDSVEHYINHAEFEMAFEGLFIEIMRLKIKPEIDFLESQRIGKELRLDQESIFDANFWDNFQNWLPQ